MTDISDIRYVWIFSGERTSFPAGVFSQRELAEAWIAKHRLSGTLTQYPVDVSAYDWTILNGLFTPSKPEHFSSAFIQKFSSAGQEHFHYEDGVARGAG